MAVSKEEYVIVNLWTSKDNKAVQGVNCGHASLTVMNGDKETYISLWPGPRQPNKYKAEFFQEAQDAFNQKFSNFRERPTSFKMNYEEDCLLEAFCEKNYREIKNISECSLEETAYRYDTDSGTFVKLTVQPKGIKPEETLLAVKLMSAKFRMVLYSFDVDKIVSEFDRLRNPEYVTGWSMAGSNFLTRNLNFSGKTSENCASIVYRCLNAGGLFSRVSSKLSFQPSSAVAPDDLLRIIVAAKVNELDLYTGNPDDWQIADIEETSLDSVEKAYDETGQNANAENDKVPFLKPSVTTCSIF